MFNAPPYATLNPGQRLLHQAASDLRPVLQQSLKSLGLDHVLEQFCELNQSSFAPYHNAYHSFFVALAVGQGAQYHRLDTQASRALHIAALYHDVNHSGGRAIDAVNIEQALIVVDELTGLQSGEQQLAKTLIHATLRPSPSNVKWSLLESILRDADLMQAYEPDDAVVTALYSGLHIEIERLSSQTMSVTQFADLSREWMNDNVVWDSEWAQTKAVQSDWTGHKARLDRLLSARDLSRVPY
jgi:hypothetical protein